MAVIPSGTSEPWFWAAREAAANDALTRLYISLAQRREEREMMMRNQRELLELKDRYTRGIYDDYGAPGTRGRQGSSDATPYYPDSAVFGPGAGTSGAPTSAAPAAPATIPGSVAPPGGPPVGKFGAAPASNQVAQGDEEPGEGETVTLSAQAKQVKPINIRPNAQQQLPSQPRVSGTGRARPEAAFVNIRPEIQEAWAAQEKKYGLPQGTLLTLLGVENAGGRSIGLNPRSAGGAEGIFQFTRGLRKEYGIPDSDLRDPIKMGEWAAKNMRRNADQLQKVANIKLGTTQDDILPYTMLHMFGIGDGPRIVAGMKLNPDMRMTDAMLKIEGRDPYRVLVNNGIPGNSTIRGAVQEHAKKVMPWQNAAIRTQDNPPVETAEAPAGATQQTTQPAEGGAGSASDFLSQRAGSRARIEGLNPVFADRLAAAVQEAEQATGSRVNINSLFRDRATQAAIYRQSQGGRRFLAAPPGRSLHERGDAADIERGPVLQWLHQNRAYINQKYGLDFLRGRAFGRDPVHIQLTGNTDPKVTFFKPTQKPTTVAQQPDIPSLRTTEGLTAFAPTASAPVVTADVFGNVGSQQQRPIDTAQVPLPTPRPQMPGEQQPSPPDAMGATAATQPTAPVPATPTPTVAQPTRQSQPNAPSEPVPRNLEPLKTLVPPTPALDASVPDNPFAENTGKPAGYYTRQVLDYATRALDAMTDERNWRPPRNAEQYAPDRTLPMRTIPAGEPGHATEQILTEAARPSGAAGGRSTYGAYGAPEPPWSPAPYDPATDNATAVPPPLPDDRNVSQRVSDALFNRTKPAADATAAAVKDFLDKMYSSVPSAPQAPTQEAAPDTNVDPMTGLPWNAQLPLPPMPNVAGWFKSKSPAPQPPPVDTGPKKVKTQPMLPSGQPVQPEQPPLGPEFYPEGSGVTSPLKPQQQAPAGAQPAMPPPPTGAPAKGGARKIWDEKTQSWKFIKTGALDEQFLAEPTDQMMADVMPLYDDIYGEQPYESA